MSDLIQQLRYGCVDAGWDVDQMATDAVMDKAADELESLRTQLAERDAEIARLRHRSRDLIMASKNYRAAVNTTWKAQNPDDCDWLVDEEIIDEDTAIEQQGDAYGALTSAEYKCEKSIAALANKEPPA